MASEAAGPPPEAVEFLPLGPMPAPLSEDLVSRASRRLRVPCRLLRSEAIEVPVLEARNQVDADRLLERLEERAGARGALLVGLTAHDIANRIFTFFFGRARLGGRAAVVSLARLTPAFYGLRDDPHLTAHRAVLEVLHEMGHLSGLPHCPRTSCLMHVVHTVEDLDARGTTFCAACAARVDGSIA